MRSQRKRLDKIESETMNQKEDAPNYLKDIYDWEDSPEGQKAIELLYSEPENNTE